MPYSVKLCLKASTITTPECENVTPLKLASANPVESLAIHPFKPTCDQTRNHPYKTVRVNVREGE
jgi:hypothetical protein